MRAQAAERCRALLCEHGADVVTEPDQATLVSWRADEPEALVDRLAEQRCGTCPSGHRPGSGVVRLLDKR